MLDISFCLRSTEVLCFFTDMNSDCNYQLRAIIHYQSNSVLCLRSLSEAALTLITQPVQYHWAVTAESLIH